MIWASFSENRNLNLTIITLEDWLKDSLLKDKLQTSKYKDILKVAIEMGRKNYRIGDWWH